MSLNKSIFSPPIWQQLTTDAPFAWHQRNEAVEGLQFTLRDLLHTDQVVDANIDALRIAKQAGTSLHEDLDFEDWGTVFIGAVLGLMFEDKELLDTALAAIGEELDRADELEFALRWPAACASQQIIAQLQKHENPLICRAVFGALYADANSLPRESLLTNEQHPAILTRLLDIAGYKRHTAWKYNIAKLYNAESLDVRYHAIRAGILL